MKTRCLFLLLILNSLISCQRYQILPPRFVNDDTSEQVRLEFYQTNLESYFVLSKKGKEFFVKVYFILPKNVIPSINISSKMKVLIDDHQIISLEPSHNPKIVEYNINTPIATTLYSITYKISLNQIKMLWNAKEAQVQINEKDQIFFGRTKNLEKLKLFFQSNNIQYLSE